MDGPGSEGNAGFLAELAEVLDAPGMVTGAAAAEPAYSQDWTSRWVGRPAAVLRPTSTGQVAAVVAAARRHRVALVPQGGNTGLVGGAVPHRGEVVLSLGRLAGCEPVDLQADQVTVAAGTTLAQLQEHLVGTGLAFGVDLGARGSATLGGMVATNAGGIHVVRYGPMRRQLVGVEAVLGTGQVVSRLGGLIKDNTGYDLAQLLCGSEGTLGVVTHVRLALVPAAGPLAVGLVALDSVVDAVELAALLRRRLPGVRALEMMVGDSLRRVLAQHAAAGSTGPSLPLTDTATAYVLVEVEGADAEGQLADQLSSLAGSVEPVDAVLASSERDRRELWAWREAHSEVGVQRALASAGVLHKLDVTVPVGELAAFCAEVTERFGDRWPAAELILFGHVGDGNLHVNVVMPGVGANREALMGGEVDSEAENEAVVDAVLELVVARGGSISAEHGIGVAKKRWLGRDRGPDEVAAMRAIKAALDPDRVLNPGALLP